jgi:S1-C subfamily serine protease
MPESLVKLEDTLESVYTQLRPSAVNIRVVQAQETMFLAIPEIPGFPFGPSTPQQPHKFFRQGSGSGFVWDTQGHIVTNNQGVLIEQVIQGSPADKAGLRGSYKPATVKGHRLLVGGDLIIAVGQQPITQISDLQAWVQQAQPGQTTTLTLLRTDKTVQVQVTLQARPATTP